jgi:hypothetical protein
VRMTIVTSCALLILQLALPSPASAQTTAAGPGPLKTAAARDWSVGTSAPARAAVVRVPRQDPNTRSWIRRHPALFGAAVGFTSGYVYGVARGDDGVFDDFTAGFNGWVCGGVGAGAGAVIGAIVGKLRK